MAILVHKGSLSKLTYSIQFDVMEKFPEYFQTLIQGSLC